MIGGLNVEASVAGKRQKIRGNWLIELKYIPRLAYYNADFHRLFILSWITSISLKNRDGLERRQFILKGRVGEEKLILKLLRNGRGPNATINGYTK